MLYALWVQNGQTTKIAEAENREQEMSLEIKKYQNQLKKAETDLERSLVSFHLIFLSRFSFAACIHIPHIEKLVFIFILFIT